ncbi:MAG: hypothetical protein ACD_67C00003G0003 [uncultured bacterium]|nr:MAG: hypothetical protein ACD_67C00003G0003 [uncultured bacterium]
MFDLTKETKLTPDLQKKYAIARIALYFAFVFAVLIVLYRILFPIVSLDFSMSTPNSSKNSLVSPRMQVGGKFPEKRLVGANSPFLFNANPIGQFSKVSISFVLDKDEASIEKTPVKINKSYQAFLYPTGKPAGFKSGQLLSTPDGSYYIVSNKTLRKFSSTDIILQLGYPKDSFMTVSQDDLKYNDPGATISDAKNYPDDTFFLIDETYYQLKDQKLSPFISARAFLSQSDPSGAIAKTTDFLSRYPLTETYSGFSSGSLVSSADSIFVISEGRSFPVETAETFLAMGFDFNDVLPVTQDELNAQIKQKQFTHNDPHPNGILFLDRKINEHFIIEDGSKRPLPTEAITKTYLSKQKPVVVDSEESMIEISCLLEKKVFSPSRYECSTSLQDLTSVIGNDYQMSAIFSKDTKIKSINATFSTPLKWDSMKNSLSKIKGRILNR